MFSGLSPQSNVSSGSVSLASGLPTTLFRTIPPERVGLNGEYDYYGLAKRVNQAFIQNFKQDEIKNIKVRQRGTVIMLLGEVPSQKLLVRLVHIVMGVSGATDVEVNGVSIVPPFGRLPLGQHPYAC